MNNNEKGKLNFNELLSKARKSDSASPDELNDFISTNLSDSQAQAVKNILSDEEKTRALLNSDAAKSLFNKFFGGKDNG
ncbi:MAG: hypothetical protein IKV44_06125, partial [Clostridia bacterium]|nr:hypothetical protein [Clostridia bacterium]